MEVALIRLNFNQKRGDGLPDFAASVVVQSTIKAVNGCKPNRTDILALSKIQFKKRFRLREFPTNVNTADKVLLAWQREICFGTGENKKASEGKTYVLVEAITVSKDIGGTQFVRLVATGDTVLVKCKEEVKLPKPDVILESARHYILHQFLLLTPGEFKVTPEYCRSSTERKSYIPLTTKNSKLGEIKRRIEQGVTSFQDNNSNDAGPLQIGSILSVKEIGNIETDDLKPCNFRLPKTVVKFLKSLSTKCNTTMTNILTDCILAKYGGDNGLDQNKTVDKIEITKSDGLYVCKWHHIQWGKDRCCNIGSKEYYTDIIAEGLVSDLKSFQKEVYLDTVSRIDISEPVGGRVSHWADADKKMLRYQTEKLAEKIWNSHKNSTQ